MLAATPAQPRKGEAPGGLAPARKTKGATRCHAVSDLVGISNEAAPTVRHARVPAHGRKADLERQHALLEACLRRRGLANRGHPGPGLRHDLSQQEPAAAPGGDPAQADKAPGADPQGPPAALRHRTRLRAPRAPGRRGRRHPQRRAARFRGRTRPGHAGDHHGMQRPTLSPLLRRPCRPAVWRGTPALPAFKDGLGGGEWRTHCASRPRWNRVKRTLYPWCQGLSQNAAKYAIIALGDALRAWRSDSQKNRFPRFRSRPRQGGLPR